MAVQIQLRRDTASNWTGTNPVLAIGEPGVETDTLKVKVGDGSTAWNSLGYSISYNFNDLNNKPTTLAGYGITDGGGSVTGTSTTTFTNKSGNISQWTNDSSYLTSVPAQSFSSLTGKPTTVAGYGITDALALGTSSTTALAGDTALFDGAYGSLSGTPTLGTAAATASTAYATSAQGTTADSAIQPNTSPTLTNATLTGYLAGPASFVIDPAAVGDDTGTVVIAGNLQVDGVQTTINSTTVAIDDLNFSIATDAADSAAANGAGISIGGAGATLVYTHATTSWDFNKPVNVTDKVTSTDIDISSNNPRIRLDDSDTDNNAEVTLDNTSLRIEVDEDDAIADSLIKFRVDSDTKAVITSDGRLGIGTDTPSETFHVQKAADDKLVYGSNPRLLLDTPTGINGLRVLGDTTPFEFKIDSGTYNGSAFSMGGTGDVSLLGTTTTVSDTFNDSPTFFFNSMRWNGSANATHFQGAIKGHTRSATNGDGYLGIGASASANHLNIQTDGNVGIGTDAPDTELHVFNSDSGATPTSNTVATFEGNDNTEISILGGSSSILALNFGHSGDNNEGIVYFNTTTGSENLQLQSTKDITLVATSGNDTAGDINFKSYNTTIMHIDGGNNRVGIGLTDPADKLDIQGADNGLTVRSVSANRPVITLVNDTTNMLQLSANGTYGAIGDGTDANRYFIFNGGDVGLAGVTDPRNKLHVGGAICNNKGVTNGTGIVQTVGRGMYHVLLTNNYGAGSNVRHAAYYVCVDYEGDDIVTTNEIFNNNSMSVSFSISGGWLTVNSLPAGNNNAAVFGM